MSATIEKPRRRLSAGMLFVRYGIAAIVILTGLILVIRDPHSHTTAEGAGGIIGAGLAILAANWFFRFGAKGDHDRDVEAAARDYYTVHGEWPTEDERRRFAKEGRWHEDQELPGPLGGAHG